MTSWGESNDAQHVALADVGARGATDVYLPLAAFYGDDAHVLDGRLGAVAGAAGDRHLDLVRHLHALEALLYVYAQRGAVAESVAAEVGAYAGFARSERLGVGVARRHIQIAPHVRQVLFGYAENVYALSAGNLDHAGVVLLGDVGDAAQLCGRGDAAVHSWNN